jgi:hypothetical protein
MVVEALSVRIKNDILHRGVSIGLAKCKIDGKGISETVAKAAPGFHRKP